MGSAEYGSNKLDKLRRLYTQVAIEKQLETK
jgi:hypothetical protein